MKKIYVVCEDLTRCFHGLYTTKRKAKARAKFEGGYIIEYPYTIENNKLNVDLEENGDDWEENEG